MTPQINNNFPQLTNYEEFQLVKYGNILPDLNVMQDGSCHNSDEELNRSAEWTSRQHELQLQQQEY